MKVLHLSTFDLAGGAGRAAYRLHRSLLVAGISSQMLVRSKFSNDPTVHGASSVGGLFWGKLRTRLDNVPLVIYQKRLPLTFSSAILPSNLARSIQKLSPDVVHIHWTGGGFLRIEELRNIKAPLVWTLHDMWAFTGGCHYSGECLRYEDKCGMCPQLMSSHEKDLSRWNWSRKLRSWSDKPINILTPSKWLSQCAAKSSLFSRARIKVLPNGFDTSIFSPTDKIAAKQQLGFSPDENIVLFGAVTATEDQRKGFHYLYPALKKLSENVITSGITLVIYGSNEPKNSPDFGFPVRYLGHVNNDERMALLNSAADVFVAPSIQDNLPNTVIEAMACGTPVVAFNIGGMPDIIEHRMTGWLAKPFFVDDLANGIKYILDDPQRRHLMGIQSRDKVMNTYASTLVANQHIEHYSDILGKTA